MRGTSIFHPSTGTSPQVLKTLGARSWIHAFAGMTIREISEIPRWRGSTAHRKRSNAISVPMTNGGVGVMNWPDGYGLPGPHPGRPRGAPLR